MSDVSVIDRPKVVLLASASIDGRLALAPDKLLLFGDPRWEAIAGESDLDIFQWLRSHHQAGATLEGSGSFVRLEAIAAPRPPVTGDCAPFYHDFLPEELLKRPNHQGWFSAVDGRGRVSWVYKDGYPEPGWEGWHLLVWVCGGTPPEYLVYLQQEQIPYLVAGEGEQVDLAMALAKMKQKLGVNCLLSTAGGKLNGALLRAGLVDEINIDFLPAIIGGSQTPSLFEAPDLTEDEWPVNLRLIWSQVQASGRVWLRYKVESIGG